MNALAQAAQAAGASQQQNPGAGAQQADNSDGETVEGRVPAKRTTSKSDG